MSTPTARNSNADETQWQARLERLIEHAPAAVFCCRALPGIPITFFCGAACSPR